jgi:hypothetical protein
MLFACRFRPRSALELDDSGQPRIEKIYMLIGECRFGIHDISRTELDPINHLPRFNMPLELGIFLGARRFGSRQRDKRAMILDTDRYRYQKFMSDIAGMDIHQHAGVPSNAIRETRNWLANVSRRNLPSADTLIALHQRFVAELPDLARAEGFDPADIPYFDFEWFVALWLNRAGQRLTS